MYLKMAQLNTAAKKRIRFLLRPRDPLCSILKGKERMKRSKGENNRQKKTLGIKTRKVVDYNIDQSIYI